MTADGPTRTTIGGRELSVSNLDKVLFPQSGFTKGQLIDYYVRIAEVMLPHLRERPLTMKRFPDGVEGKSFFEKHIPSHAPEWVHSVTVPSSDGPRTIPYAMVERPPDAGLGGQPGDDRAPRAAVARRAAPQAAGAPGPHGVRSRPRRGNVHRRVLRRGRLRHRTSSQQDGIESFAKTSGSKGLQLYAVGRAQDDLGRAAGPRPRDRPQAGVGPPGSRRLQHAQVAAPGTGSSSTGARTTRPRRRSPCTRSGPMPARPSRRRSRPPRCGAVPRRRTRSCSLRDRRRAAAGREARRSLRSAGACVGWQPNVGATSPLVAEHSVPRATARATGGPDAEQPCCPERERQYERARGPRRAGRREPLAEEIAARTVNKDRARALARAARESDVDTRHSAERRGGLRSPEAQVDGA